MFVANAFSWVFPGALPLQRWYTRFPHGLPAIGLLVLRVAIGAKLLLLGLTCLLGCSAVNFATFALGVLATGAGTCFVLGLLTPLMAGISALAETAVYVWHPVWAASVSDFPNFEITAVAIAIAMLGPGAISLDAYFFGRRKIVIARVVRS